jgi:aminopeptidase N
VRVDGQATNAWRMDGADLLVDLPGEAHEVEIETAINPAANSQLMGLYASNGMLCTQCEAEGFPPHHLLPRPARRAFRLFGAHGGPKAQFPVLLSNGNRTASGRWRGRLALGEWHDPWPKPSYLFALVAGNWWPTTTPSPPCSGRKVDLNIWVREGDRGPHPPRHGFAQGLDEVGRGGVRARIRP